jgi:hypothetical protein
LPLITLPLSAVEAVEILPDHGEIAPAAYIATFLADAVGGELGMGASMEVAVAPEGGRQTRVGFWDGFSLPSKAESVFLTWREVTALPIEPFRTGAPTIYWYPTGAGTNLGSPVVHQFCPRAQNQR